MTQAEQQVLPTIIGETQSHKGNAVSQEVVEHESYPVVQTFKNPLENMTKGSETMQPTTVEIQIHESGTKDTEEEMVVIEHQNDILIQASSKPLDGQEAINMSMRDEDVEGSEKKDEANKEIQNTLVIKEVQEEANKESGQATYNTNKGTYFFNTSTGYVSFGS
ncbi:hypothetical protein L7F22_042313 [Adiantum nelumboides]|nr:hypothetical protein [Adiantum nelumboides]